MRKTKMEVSDSERHWFGLKPHPKGSAQPIPLSPQIKWMSPDIVGGIFISERCGAGRHK
jgi:hypothetical protein